MESINFLVRCHYAPRCHVEGVEMRSDKAPLELAFVRASPQPHVSEGRGRFHFILRLNRVRVRSFAPSLLTEVFVRFFARLLLLWEVNT